MNYGYFDDEQREYVITNPKIPVRWINYVGGLAFGGFVDQTGGGLICKGDPSLNRIVKYIPQLPASSFNGETLYLRTRLLAGYRIFSPFFVPTLDPYDRYECRVGLGYTRICSEFYGLLTEVIIFVPNGDGRVIRDIRITNLTGDPQTVDAIPVVEYTHPDALKQFTNADWIPQTMQSRAIHETNGCVTLLQYPFMHRDTQVNFFTSNRLVASFETDRARFLGDHEYGTWARPLSLFSPQLSNTEARRGDNIAALLLPMGVLLPGETRRFITQLGQAPTWESARGGIEAFRDEERVDRALAELAAFWDDYLDQLQVHTPDAGVNSMLNVHNPRQCNVTLNWSRYLSLYQLGLGTRGIGFRDSSQDVLAVLASAPEAAKTLIRKLLSVQKRDGCAMHQFNPLTIEGSAGDAMEREDRPHYYSDDHLWIVLAVTAYLKETGDLAFIDEQIPFYEKDRSGAPCATGSVLEHLRRALAFTRGDTGQHGLPRLGFADWNDTINLASGAESLFTANLYGKALLEMIELANLRGDVPAREAWLEDYAAMRQAVNEYGWDGEWYLSYFDADGTPLGSRQNQQGKIYVNSQSWAVISGFAVNGRGRQALDAVFRLLNARHGIKLSTPGFDGYDPTRGGVTTYPPGAKENGGIFLHTNPWVIIAEALQGNGDRAFAYYQQINPATRNERIDEYEVEPYVYAQNILGDEHPQFGLGRNSWLSGTASWAYRAATQYILGIRPEYAGLRVDPCIPSAWEGFEVNRVFRGVRYQIRVRNPRHVCRGVRSLRIDGEQIPGNLVPSSLAGSAHTVEAELGASLPE